MDMFTLFLIAHLIGGFSSLLLLWIPLLTKKGGKWHNRVGWLFVYGMSLVSVSAVGMASIRIFVQPDTTPERMQFSIFLLFIATLSAVSAYYGIRVLKFKKKEPRHRQPLDLAASALLFLAGLGCVVYGMIIGNSLITFFPLLGVFLGAGQLRYWLKPMTTKKSWIVEHITGMLTCSISTVTAFTVFGAPRLIGVDSSHILLWFLPTIIFLPLIFWFTNKYGAVKKSGGATRAS
ncbi:membrane protein [Pontibacillus chungwhensis BH030062]|uniref:Membrane protein n=2 Tax=Pontibacillus chungwhensis TaxID=265426 RepID=A0A0A2V844_9BACI|nr:membrane protein [Pontibacillus chungwhensis BH030062]